MLLNQYQEAGYLLARGLFSPAEAAHYREHFMRLRTSGTYPLDHLGVDTDQGDPILKYPRMTHIQRWDQLGRQWLTEARIARWLTRLTGQAPLLVQGMVYFKPPGSRGQALHQDQFYLKAQPGTCMAAWMALEAADKENGCLQVVPGSHRWPLLCTQKADTTLSFTDVGVPVPAGLEAVLVPMGPGDVIFFNGSLIHGSPPNASDTRFRCAITGHYISAEARQVAKYYQPALSMDGRELWLEISEGGGPCGVWVDREGRPVVEVQEGWEWRPEAQGSRA
ncbi:MAG: phytanoyl-CoA dioxygenase family protein [Candidatus Latescibacteria bacterium]|nr:phytanoyl-CoA dioxygenase family protein [Candidatus Latescibacterota bacterium]